jgi:hypothetical protein
MKPVEETAKLRSSDDDERQAGTFTLSAPSGATVVTPITTLIDEMGAGVDVDDVATALGLPASVENILTFNPFTTLDGNAAAVEKVSMQLSKSVLYGHC